MPTLTSALGLALASLRRWADALDAFREAVRLNPADADALYNMGLMLNLLRRHEEALAAYSSAVRLKPDYANAWGNLGMTAYLLGRHSESVEAFERVRSWCPRPSRAGTFSARRGKSLGNDHGCPRTRNVPRTESTI
jgi:tetratricopeptide (TPR) repeat protein